MRSLCVALLVACVAVASADPTSLKEKRLLGGSGGLLDLGGVLGDVVCTLSDLLNGVLTDVICLVEEVVEDLVNFLKNKVLPAIFGKHGVLGQLLCNIFDGDLVENLLCFPLFGFLNNILNGLLANVLHFVLGLVNDVLCVLDGIDLSDIDAVVDALLALPSYLVCVVYYLIPDCRPACNRICRC